MRKHVCCTAVCVVCTAVLFYLHFFCLWRSAVQQSLCWLALPALLLPLPPQVASAGLGNHGFRLTISSHGFCQLIWCAALGTIPYVLCIDPYSLDNWIVFLLWIAVTVIELVHREDNSAAYSIAMVLALCVTGAFLLVVHPITVSQAQSIVEQAGYTDCVYYKVDADGNLAHEDGRPDGAIIYVPSPESAERSEYYAFSAVKGKKEYGILISRFRGTIDVEQKRGV